MAVTSEAGGSQTAIIDTEHSLHVDAGAKVFVLAVDLTNLVADDVVELRVKRAFASGGTKRTVYYAVYTGALVGEEKGSVSPPITSPWSYEATLKQVAGTGRAFDWSVESV